MSKKRNTSYYIGQLGNEMISKENEKEISDRLKRLDDYDKILSRLNPRLQELEQKNKELSVENLKLKELLRDVGRLHASFVRHIDQQMRKSGINEMPISKEYKEHFDAMAVLAKYISHYANNDGDWY